MKTGPWSRRGAKQSKFYNRDRLLRWTAAELISWSFFQKNVDQALFTLDSVYGTRASGAEQKTETNNSN